MNNTVGLKKTPKSPTPKIGMQVKVPGYRYVRTIATVLQGPDYDGRGVILDKPALGLRYWHMDELTIVGSKTPKK